MDHAPAYIRPVIPNGCRRASWHDYRSRCIYMITLNRAPGIPSFSVLEGIPGDRLHKPRAVPTALGGLISSRLSALKDKYSFVSILRRVIMPEHIHFVIFITAPSASHLGEIIAYFKGDCANAWSNGETQPFEEGYHDRILLKAGQLQRMLRYVSDNPRRRLERAAHPDFHCRRRFTAPDGQIYEAYGNIHLLEDTDIEPVRISSRYTPEELRQKKILWQRTIENSGVLISPFISEAERRVRDYAYANGGRLIIIENNGFGKNFAPKEPRHTLCSEGRLLIIAPISYTPRSIRPTRAECLRMNDLAALFSSRS